MCALAAIHIPAQARQISQYAVTSWAEENGLPSSDVRAIAQDRDGVLWLGTNAGLVRFNGMRFVLWEERYSAHLRTAEITALCVAENGDLWVATSGGRITRIRDGGAVDFTQTDGIPRVIMRLFVDHQGVVWAGGEGGLSRFRNGHWESVYIGGFPVQSVRAFYEDRQHNFWVGGPTWIARRQEGSDAFERWDSRPVFAFSQDARGEIWVTDPSRGFRSLIQRMPSQVQPNASQIDSGLSLLNDREAGLWVGTQGSGLLHLSAPDGKLERYDAGQGLAHDVVNSLYEDREGNVWVGTQGGLDRFVPNPIPQIDVLTGATKAVHSIAAARDGSLWVATAGGLVRYSKQLRRVYTEDDGLPSSNVFGLHEDADGVLWIATSRGMARWKDGRLSSVPLPRKVTAGVTFAVTVDREGALWLWNTNIGLLRWADGRQLPVDPALEGKWGRSLLTDSRGRVWIGFYNGGIGVIEDGKLRLLSERDGLAHGSVNAIFEDGSGAVWIGTQTGLSRYRNGQLNTLSGARLPGTIVRSITADQKGYLWLRLNSGLIRLASEEFDKALQDPSYRPQLQLFDVSDNVGGAGTGLTDSIARAADGMIWMVTATGLARFDPQRLPPPHPLPAVRIEDIVADGHRLDSRLQAHLPPRTSRLQIDYVAATLSSSRHRYRYMLDGFDLGWIDAGLSRQAVYTNLAPGSYRFRVTAGSADGRWSESSTTWKFVLEPAFTQTRWFYGALALAVLAAVLIGWRIRVAELRRRFALVLGERARMAGEIHDTLLQSLAGLELEVDDIASQLHPTEQRTRGRLDRVRRNIQRYIGEARQSIWDLRTLGDRDLAMALRETGGQLAGSNGLRFQFSATGEPVRCTAAVRDNLLQIGREAVNNAVRHAEANMIDMELVYQRDSIRLRVSDDGKGFDAKATVQSQTAHWGLGIMRERAQRVGGQLRLDTRPGGGTKVEVTVPLPSSPR